jgi:hypothetical protein
MTITLRIPKGSELTHAELDGNFTDLVGQAAALQSGKADSAHSHSGLSPAGGAAGQVLKKIDATSYNYSWQDDATGTGGTAASQAEAEGGVENTKFMTSLRAAQAIVARAKDALLTGYAAGANAVVAATDTITQAIGKLQAQVSAKADLLAKATEAGTSFNVTAAGHANRDTETTNAAPVAATFVFSGMVDGDEGVIYQRGAGVVTLQAGPAYSFSAGVSLLTTAGVGNWISWRYLGGTSVLITGRAQAATGSSNNRCVADPTTRTLVDDTADNIVTTLTLGALAAGTMLEIDFHVDQATSGVNGAAVLFWDLNTTQVTFQASPDTTTATGRVMRCSMSIKALTGADNVYATYPLLLDGSAGTDPVQKATVALTGSVNLRLRSQKNAGGVGRAIRIQMINVNVRQP